MGEANLKKSAIKDLRQILNSAVLSVDFKGVSSNQIDDWLSSFLIEVPADDMHGDFATNIAMVGARILKMSPKLIAEQILSKTLLLHQTQPKLKFLLNNHQ